MPLVEIRKNTTDILDPTIVRSIASIWICEQYVGYYLNNGLICLQQKYLTLEELKEIVIAIEKFNNEH